MKNTQLKNAFYELKETVNDMAQDMGYKVRYHTGELGVPIVIEIDGVYVRALKVIKGTDEIVIAKVPGHVYAFRNGIRWDITANFLYYEAKKYMHMKESMKKKLRKEQPILGTLELVMQKLSKEGMNINELIDIFLCNDSVKYPLREIRI